MKGFSEESMRVNVDRISDDGLVLQIEAPVDSFPALKELEPEETVRFLSPFQLEIRVRRVSRFVEASGRLRTSVGLSCSRCLGDFTHPLSIPFEATYTDEMPAREGPPGDDGIELSAEAIDLFAFRGREIELAEAIQEQVLLALPIRPLCRKYCKGLCPQCGADLNQGDCGCVKTRSDPRFAALKNLNLDNR